MQKMSVIWVLPLYMRVISLLFLISISPHMQGTWVAGLLLKDERKMGRLL